MRIRTKTYKMKKVQLVFILMLPLFCIGQSESYAPAPASAAVMTKSFTATTLTESQLGAFQQRGIQKVQDLYNYLSIVSNPEYDKRLREEATKQAKQLFYGSNCSINGKIAMDYIDSCLALKKKVEWKPVDITIKEAMILKQDVRDSSYYEGSLTFKVSNDSAPLAEKRAYIILAKEEKQFGSEKKYVWTVYIGRIE
jgi:hypothetical protein